MPQISTGVAFTRGIPAATVGWNGHTATIFTEIRKKPLGDIAHTNDNNGERLASNRVNKRYQLTFSAKPVAATPALALAIAADLPKVNAIVALTCAGDTQISAAGSAIVDDVETSYTPEGEATIQFTITKWIGKTFAFAAVT